MSVVVFSNAKIFDGTGTDYLSERHVVVEDGVIREVSETRPKVDGADVIDVHDGVVMPGLIDAHVHVMGSSTNVLALLGQSASYSAHHASQMLRHALDCGFTSLRDMGGGDFGTAQALEDGLIVGPRLFYAGRALSMTGGHGDLRSQSEEFHLCGCRLTNKLCHVVDGEDSVRWAAREELRKGAHCIKLMASGGVLSLTDPVWMDQFTDREIGVAVEEAKRWRTYVAAHCHPASAISRCARLGIRTIEHATLIDDAAAAEVRKADAYVVPTLTVIFALIERGKELGLPPKVQAKAREFTNLAMAGLEFVERSGLKAGFGTDLLGSLFNLQSREFIYRREVQDAAAVLRSATSVGAEILMRPDLGRIAPGCRADLLVVRGDPLVNISLLAQDGRALDVIMKDGRFYKRTIH